MSAVEIMVPLSGTDEQLLYLRNCWYTFPTQASTALKACLEAQVILSDDSLFLFGTETDIIQSTVQIQTSELLQNLKSSNFSGSWEHSFILQLRDFILLPINNSDKDVLCILDGQQEHSSSGVSFTIQVFSHDCQILQETLQMLNVC